MAEKTLRIGLVGYGFMGRAHSNAFRTAGNFFDLGYTPELTAVCGRNREQAEAHAAQWGFSSVETEWEKLVARDDIDMIDITAPNDMHKDIAIAAAEAGKMVMCEKPLGRNAEESRAMVDAVEKAGVANMVWYNYRRIPAVTLAKQLIDEGRLGRIYHYRAKFLQDWTIADDLPQGGAGLWVFLRAPDRDGPAAWPRGALPARPVPHRARADGRGRHGEPAQSALSLKQLRRRWRRRGERRTGASSP